jgi:hypothetical protein
MFTPFFFHWYVGVVPPLVGVAVKFTAVPEQTVVASAAILTAGVRLEVTVTVTVLLVATVVEVHAALLVMTKEMASLFAGVIKL